MFVFPVDSNVEPPHFKLCKWVASDDSEMNNGEAKCKDDELSPAKPETPLALDEGTSLYFAFLLLFSN